MDLPCVQSSSEIIYELQERHQRGHVGVGSDLWFHNKDALTSLQHCNIVKCNLCDAEGNDNLLSILCISSKHILYNTG